MCIHFLRGQRVAIALLAVTLSLPVSAALAAPVGYNELTIDLSGVSGFRGAAALAYDSTGNLYVAEGNDFLNPVNQSRIVRVDPAGNVSTFTTLVGNDSSTISIGGMAVDPASNRLLVTDQAVGAGTLYGLNLSTGNKTSLLPNGTVPFIDDVAVRPGSGQIVVSNADFGGSVLQIDPLAVSTSTLANTAGFTGGIAFDAAGDLVYVESVTSDFINFTGDIYRLTLDAAGAQLQVTGSDQLASGLAAAFDLASDGESDLFLTGSGGLFELPDSGGIFPFDSQAFSGEIAYLAGSSPFAPFAGPDGGQLAYIPDFNSMTIRVFTPTAAAGGVPEPSTLALLAVAIGALAGARRLRRR